MGLRKTVFGSTKNAAGSNLNVGLVAGYKFEDDYLDSVGTHHGSPIGSPTFIAGKSGQAVNFINDTVTRYLTVPDSDDFTFGTGSSDVPFTIAVWVYFDRVNDYANWIINKRYGAYNNEWQLVRINGTISMYKWSTAGLQRVYFPFSTAAQWVHIVYSDNGISPKFYLNGIEKTVTVTGSHSYFQNLAAPVIFGVAGYSLTDTLLKLKGKIDECYIWKNRALLQDDVTELYSGGSGKFIPF